MIPFPTWKRKESIDEDDLNMEGDEGNNTSVLSLSSSPLVSFPQPSKGGAASRRARFVPKALFSTSNNDKDDEMNDDEPSKITNGGDDSITDSDEANQSPIAADDEALKLVDDEEEEYFIQDEEDDEEMEAVMDIHEMNYQIAELKKGNHVMDSKFMDILKGNQSAKGSDSSNYLNISKRFEKVCARKVSELDSVYKRTYFLPDEEHFRVKEEYETLKLEQFTWDLLFSFLEDERRQKVTDESKSSIDVWRVSHREAIDDLLQRDEYARKLNIIIKWLERNAKERLDIETEGNWMYTDKKGAQKTDPDSIYKEKNTLDENDLRQERAIIKKTWSLVRSGQVKEAQMFCRKHDQFWRAATLAGSELYHNPRLLSKDSNFDEGLETVGNQNRFVYLNSVMSMIQSDDIDNNDIYNFEKSIYGTICGDLQSMLRCCFTWEDHLWAYCKAALEYKINEKLSQYVPEDSEDKLYKQKVLDFQQKNNLSLVAIISALNSSSNEKIREEAVYYHHVVQSFIMCDKIPDLVEYLLSTISNPPQSSMEFMSNLLRFSAHFVILWTIRALDHVDSGIESGTRNAILVKFIHYLIKTRQYDVIAFYTRYIDPNIEDVVPGNYRSILYSEAVVAIERAEKEYRNAEKLLTETKTDEKLEEKARKVLRNLLLTQAKENNLDVEEIAELVAKKSLDESSPESQFSLNQMDAYFLLDPKNNALQKLKETETTEQDNNKINSIDWLCIDDVRPLICLAYTNKLLREFVRLGKLSAFEKTMENLVKKIDTRLANYDGQLSEKEEADLDEYLAWRLYSESISSYDAWSQHLQVKPEFKGIEATTQSEKSKNEMDLLTFTNTTLREWTKQNGELFTKAKDTISRLVHNPWLTTKHGQVSHQDDDLNKLKHLCLPDMVFCLYQLLSYEEEHELCLQLADVVAAEGLDLYKFFSKEQLVELLKLMQVSELRAIQQKQEE